MDAIKPTKKDKVEIKIVDIIEDDLVIRNNLVRYFDIIDDIHVGIVTNSAEQYIYMTEQRPDYKSDIMLLDIGLPGMSGLEAIPKLVEVNPDMDIIMLTTFEEEKKVLKAMCLGAVAYLSKRTSLADILEAIRVVHKGGSYMSPMIARDIFNHFLDSDKNPFDELLTKRQREVLHGMIDGKSHNDIASELYISAQTVGSHVKNIYQALHVRNKAEAIVKYLKAVYH